MTVARVYGRRQGSLTSVEVGPTLMVGRKKGSTKKVHFPDLLLYFVQNTKKTPMYLMDGVRSLETSPHWR